MLEDINPNQLIKGTVVENTTIIDQGVPEPVSTTSDGKNVLRSDQWHKDPPVFPQAKNKERNMPCPYCSSGKKFKKCHGAAAGIGKMV